MRHLVAGVFALGVAVAMPVAAQTLTIDPGMTRAEVVATLGKPIGERASGSYLYLFYPNNCEVRCGMQDLVILQNDLVVDAIFRSSKRTYSGTSSSPNALTPSANNNGSIRTREEGDNAPAPQATPARSNSSTSNSPSRGGVVSGSSATRSSETPTSGGTVTSPASPANRGTPSGTAGNTANPRGMDPNKVLDNVPLNPRDTTTIQPSRTQGQLTPSSRDQQPVPFSGSKPSPRDSAVRAKTGAPPDTVKPPRE